jgi:hypothetical protein
MLPHSKKSSALRALLETEGRVVVFRRSLAQICGEDQVAGLFLNQCLYWTDRTTDEDGWFFKSQKEWHRELLLTRHQLDRVRTLLRSKGFIEEKLCGNAPPVIHYRVKLEVVESAVGRLAGDRHVGHSICPERASEFVGKPEFNLSGTDNTYKEVIDDNKDYSIRNHACPENLTREERDRRTRFQNTRQRGLRDMERHPPEEWESPLSENERYEIARKRTKASMEATPSHSIAAEKGERENH